MTFIFLSKIIIDRVFQLFAFFFLRKRCIKTKLATLFIALILQINTTNVISLTGVSFLDEKMQSNCRYMYLLKK